MLLRSLLNLRKDINFLHPSWYLLSITTTPLQDLVRIKGKVEQSKERSSTLSYTYVW